MHPVSVLWQLGTFRSDIRTQELSRNKINSNLFHNVLVIFLNKIFNSLAAIGICNKVVESAVKFHLYEEATAGEVGSR